jgi:hypothetical protein
MKTARARLLRVSPLLSSRLSFDQLLSSHHSCLPGILTPADQPIQARKSIRVVCLRPKARQTDPLLVPPYRERRATGQ